MVEILPTIANSSSASRTDVFAGLCGFSSVLLSSGRRDPVVLNLQPDGTVLLFTCAIALATGILFGLVPAMRTTAAGPGPTLKADSGMAPRTRSRLLPALVVSQVALSLVLLVGAGLFVRTLRNLEQVDPGFRREGVLVVNLDTRGTGYKGASVARYAELLQGFERIPGVAGASMSTNTPLSGGVWSQPVSVNGQPLTKEASHFNRVAPHFFRTMGTPMVLGRDFDQRDEPGATRVAIVNETFVHKYLGNVNPLGQRFTTAEPEPGMEIVGVVKDTVTQSLRESPQPSVYLPYFQYPQQAAFASFEIRARGSLSQVAASVRDELRTQFPQTPVQAQIQTLTEQVNRALIQERLLAVLGMCFGALALILAAVGLYGLLAYTVARSRSEIGIRMALGSQRAEVLWAVFKGALRLFALGTVLGIPAAIAGTRLIASWLFGLTASDPLTIVSAITMLGVTVGVAAFLPALRASRVDPIVALRYE